MNSRRIPSSSAKFIQTVAIVVLSLMASLDAEAASYTWQAPTGDWLVAANWGGTVPTVNDFAYILSGRTANVTAIGANCNTLSLGNAGGAGFLQMTGGSLAVVNNANVGDTGMGTFTQTAGTSSITGALNVGNSVGSQGSFTLGGSGQIVCGGEVVGVSGIGNFTQTGGTNGTPNSIVALTLGQQPSGVGYYNLSGNGQLYMNGEAVGFGGSGSFTQSGGSNIVNGNGMILGNGVGVSGSYSLNAGVLTTSSLSVGNIGSGFFSQSGGTNNVANTLALGYFSGSSGTYTLTGGLLSESLGAFVGYSGAGSVVQTGGTNSVAGTPLGVAIDAPGSYSLGGNGVLLSPVSEMIGSSNVGSMTQTGGTNSVGAFLACGYTASGTGTYTMSGGQLIAQTEYIGYYGKGMFTQSGGTNTATTALTLTYVAGGNGTYNLNGGLLTIPALTAGPGKVAFNFNGGTLQASRSFAASIPMTLGGIATFDTAGYAMTLSGSLSGVGGLTKIGSGTMVMTGSNSFSGATSILGGGLEVNGSLASPVTVYNGGILSGTGSLTSVIVNSGGTLSPGDAPGPIQLSGNLSLQTGAIMNFMLDATTDSDQVLMPSGTLSLSGQDFNEINISPLANFGPGTYILVAPDSTMGTLGPNDTETIDGLQATLSVQGNQDLVVTVTPEPGTPALLATGFVGLLAIVRRRKRRAIAEQWAGCWCH